MIRVLHVVGGRLFGGVESMLVTLARNRAAAPEMDSEFALCCEGRLRSALEQVGGRAHVIGAARVRNPISIFRARAALLDLIRQRKVDVMVCHMTWAQALFGSVARSAKIPQIFAMHDAASGKPLIEKLARRVRPDLALCNSEFTKSTLSNLYPNAPAAVYRVPVERPSANIDRSRVRRELGAPDDAVVVVQAGRMEAWKGYQSTLVALASIAHKWRYWIVGATQRRSEIRYVENLRRTAARLKIADRVTFTGFRADVDHVLAAADIYCQPNERAEPFGIAIVEGMYARLPIVTSAVGGARESVTDRCGFLVPNGNLAALISSLDTLARDPSLRLKMGENAYRRAVEIADPAKCISEIAALISASIDRSRYDVAEVAMERSRDLAEAPRH